MRMINKIALACGMLGLIVASPIAMLPFPADAQFAPGPGAGGGSVTSVAVTMPSEFSVSGSPITTSGIIAVSKASQTQNLLYASPSGSSGAPTFRGLTADDGGTPNWRIQSSSLPVAFRFNTWSSNDNYLNSTAPVYKIGTTTLTGSLGFYAAPIGTANTAISFNTGATLSPAGLFDFPIGITVPTRTAGDSTSNAASTAFVTGGIATAVSPLAPKASPVLTGTPTAPTPSAGDNSTKIATTAYVDTGLALKAPLASPALTGTPTAPTQSAGDNSTKIATTGYVDRNLSGSGGSVTINTASANTDLMTGIPSDASLIVVAFNGVNNSGSFGLQVGYDASYTATYSGYFNNQIGGAGTWGTNITLSGNSVYGTYTLARLGATNTWLVNGSVYVPASATINYVSGSVVLTSPLDRVRVNSSTNFTGGTASVRYYR